MLRQFIDEYVVDLRRQILEFVVTPAHLLADG